MRDVKEEKVEKIEVSGDELKGIYKDSGSKVAIKEPGRQALELLRASDLDLTKVMVDKTTISNGHDLGVIDCFLANCTDVGVLFFIFRQARGSQDGMMGIGRSKAKLFIKGKQMCRLKMWVAWTRRRRTRGNR
jgi:ATP-dependent Zn protease